MCVGVGVYALAEEKLTFCFVFYSFLVPGEGGVVGGVRVDSETNRQTDRP